MAPREIGSGLRVPPGLRGKAGGASAHRDGLSSCCPSLGISGIPRSGQRGPSQPAAWRGHWSERQLGKQPQAPCFCPCIQVENGHRFLCLYLLGIPDGTRPLHLPGSVFMSEPRAFLLPPTSGVTQLFPGPKWPQMPPRTSPLQTESQVSASVTGGRPPPLPLPCLASSGLGWRREPHTDSPGTRGAGEG